MSIRRSTDSICLQYIWNAIEACSRDSVEATFYEILSFIQKEYDSKITAGKLQSELSNAVTDKCVNCINCCYVKCELPPALSKDSHDCYCFECHGPGYVVECPTCFRVFHPDCLPVAAETQQSFYLPYENDVTNVNSSQTGLPPNEPCAVCQRLSRASTSIDSTDLHKIFMVILDWIRNKINWKTMQVVGYLNETLRNNYFVYQQINTRIITERMRANPASKDGYPNRTSLLVDLDNLVHNTSVFYGTKNDMSNMARQIRFQLKKELRESAYCIDCFLRSPLSTSTARLTAPCRVPHRLLWFQHNGWSFRPCKLLYESADGYEVICFGGRHERALVPLSRAVDMSFTALELGLRMTPPLKKALDEAEEYKANQGAYTNSLDASSNPSKLKVDSIKAHVTDNASLSANADVNTPNNPTSSLPRKRKSNSGRNSVKPSNKPDQGSKKCKSVVSKMNDTHAVPNTTINLWRNNIEDSEGNLTSLESDADSSISTGKPHPSRYSSKVPNLTKSGLNCAHSSASVKQRRSYRANAHEYCSNDDNSLLCDGTGYSSSNSSVPLNSNSGSFRTSTLPTPKTRQTIRIKPLPVRSESVDSHAATSDSKSVVTRTDRSDDHCARMKSTLSNSSSSSAISCPSSGHATLPALASDEHIPTDVSQSPLSSVESRVSLVSEGSKTSRVKCRKSSKPKRLYTGGENASNANTDTSSPSTRLVISRVGHKHETASISSVAKTNERLGSNLSRRHNGDNHPSSPSSISDAESDSSISSSTTLSTSSSSSVTSSTTSQMSSSLSAHSSLISQRRLSVSTMSSTTGMKSMTVKPKQPLAKSQSHPVIDRKLPTADVKSGHDVINDTIPKLTKSKTGRRSCLRLDNISFKGPNITDPVDVSVLNREHSISEQMDVLPKRISCNTNGISNVREVSHSSAPNSTTKASYTSHRVSSLEHGSGRHGSMVVYNTTYSSQNKAPSSYHDHTPVTLCGSHPVSSLGPTPPSNSSAASSCYSSVSPAALSSTSGLGSSVSDQKSVDASPGEVATVLGTASVPCSSNGTISQTAHCHNDMTLLKTEDRIHRIYADRLIALTSERDQAREEVHRRDALIAELKRAHEAELKRTKQRTWCQVCLNEAFYHCCPGTAYCSETCQLQHWTLQHNQDCRRRSENQSYQQQTRS